ncbi:MAG: hypothetical protein BRD55_07045 [Bacteroidetes bacterium SW_9_63_38]|nr:MAG: hypothetical protein BRD55_07045 [Bacteroidetes bacterium SW_9_63_38]
MPVLVGQLHPQALGPLADAGRRDCLWIVVDAEPVRLVVRGGDDMRQLQTIFWGKQFAIAPRSSLRYLDCTTDQLKLH